MDEPVSILTCYPPDCRPIHIEPLGNAGGMSGANFWRITAPRGTLVLRRWPTEHPTPDRLRFIHAVVRHAAQFVDFLPVPIRTRDGQSFIHAAGHLWELAPWMPGTADYELAPSDEKLRAAMTALAQFHNATADFQPSPDIAEVSRAPSRPAIPRRLERLRELTQSKIQELAIAIDDVIWPQFTSLSRTFLAALPNAIPPAIAQLEPLANVALPLQPCLRDIWHDHVLFIGNEVTGLIDAGAVDIDTPATDIARLLGSLAGEASLSIRQKPSDTLVRPDIWRKGLAAYSETRPLSANESLAVFALNTANPILAGCNWIRWIYIQRRTFQEPQRIQARFQRLISQLSV